MRFSNLVLKLAPSETKMRQTAYFGHSCSRSVSTLTTDSRKVLAGTESKSLNPGLYLLVFTQKVFS